MVAHRAYRCRLRRTRTSSASERDRQLSARYKADRVHDPCRLAVARPLEPELAHDLDHTSRQRPRQRCREIARTLDLALTVDHDLESQDAGLGFPGLATLSQASLVPTAV